MSIIHSYFDITISGRRVGSRRSRRHSISREVLGVGGQGTVYLCHKRTPRDTPSRGSGGTLQIVTLDGTSILVASQLNSRKRGLLIQG